MRIVIGPATSTELNELQYYADQKGIMLISPSGTAPSLSVVGNNVLRFASDDTYQAQAISRLMWQEGIRVVVPMWRTDIDGNELEGAVRQDFEKLGGTVLPGIGYVPDTGDFSSSLNRINFIMWNQDLKSLASKVSQVITHYGAGKVGVYLVAFDEVADDKKWTSITIIVDVTNHLCIEISPISEYVTTFLSDIAIRKVLPAGSFFLVFV